MSSMAQNGASRVAADMSGTGKAIERTEDDEETAAE